MKAAPAVRTFVAVETPGPVRDSLSALQERLKGACPGVRWEPNPKLHATLVFLGDVARDRLEKVTGVISSIVRAHASFDATVEEVGCFPNARNARIVWVGLRNADGRLARLKSDLDSALAAEGFEADERPFRPHVTIGRAREQGRGLNLTSVLETVTFEPISFRAGRIAVLKSELRPGGSVYSLLQGVELQPV